MTRKLPRYNKATVYNRGRGWTINEYGYVRITKGRYRGWYYHRMKAAQSMAASSRKLTPDFTVDHLCGNKRCECPDFHLLILPKVMKDALDGGNVRKGFKRHHGVH